MGTDCFHCIVCTCSALMTQMVNMSFFPFLSLCTFDLWPVATASSTIDFSTSSSALLIRPDRQVQGLLSCCQGWFFTVQRQNDHWWAHPWEWCPNHMTLTACIRNTLSLFSQSPTLKKTLLTPSHFHKLTMFLLHSRRLQQWASIGKSASLLQQLLSHAENSNPGFAHMLRQSARFILMWLTGRNNMFPSLWECVSSVCTWDC